MPPVSPKEEKAFGTEVMSTLLYELYEKLQEGQELRIRPSKELHNAVTVIVGNKVVLEGDEMVVLHALTSRRIS